MEISLLRYGFLLILLSLVGGFFVSATKVPRLALSAHTIGVLGGVLLIVVGAIWPHFQLAQPQSSWLKWSWVYSSYVNWFAVLIGALLGTGKATPVASGGLVGKAPAEGIVAGLLATVAVASLIAAGLSLWGLRP